MIYFNLSDCAIYGEDRVNVAYLSKNNYISTENMLPDRRGICPATSLPNIHSVTKFVSGDILLSNIRPYFKKIWLAEYNGGCSNDVLVIRAKNGTDPHFLYYVLSDTNFFNYATATAKGTKMPRGSKAAIMKYLIPAFDLPTQEKIASILSAYDDAIENNNKRIKILEKMAENLYREWFVRMRFPGHETAEYENGLPKGWSVQKVGEIVSRLPFNKLYKKSDLLPDGNVIVVDQSAEEYIGFHNDEPSHFSDINHPIIIFGDHSCKYQLMTQNFSLGENVIPFTGKNCNTIFLFYAIRGIVTTTEYKRHWGELITKKILFPQIELQNKFAKMIAPCLQLERQLSSNNYNLTKQRNYQLLRLMSGKMEVTSR